MQIFHLMWYSTSALTDGLGHLLTEVKEEKGDLLTLCRVFSVHKICQGNFEMDNLTIFTTCRC